MTSSAYQLKLIYCNVKAATHNGMCILDVCCVWLPYSMWGDNFLPVLLGINEKLF